MGVFLRDCPHCPATHSTFTITWSKWQDDTWRASATCGACRDAVIAVIAAPHNRDPSGVTGDIEKTHMTVFATWPARQDAVAPPYTPRSVAARFTDGEFNFQNGRWNAAVGMYRAALDLATKELQAEGGTFFARLAWLHQKGRVTLDIKDWADHVRVEGNGALHDPDEFTEVDATALRHFTEMFLRYVFEMPGKVAEFRAPKPSP